VKITAPKIVVQAPELIHGEPKKIWTEMACHEVQGVHFQAPSFNYGVSLLTPHSLTPHSFDKLKLERRNQILGLISNSLVCGVQMSREGHLSVLARQLTS